MPPNKLHIRTALRLREMYLARAAHAAARTLLDRLTAYDHALERAQWLFQAAAAEGLSANTPALRRGLYGLVKSVRVAVREISNELNAPSVPVPDLRSFVEELAQLEREFGELEIDRKDKSLSVATEPIELEGVYLGPFSIQLAWPRLAQHAGSSCFKVVALDPHPAATSDSVTHPHVRDEMLCAGEASTPIARALEQGRLADAFCLVRGVLTNYNASSPHIALDRWDGTGCHECGCGCGADDLYSCGGCDHDFCDGCSGTCQGCEEIRCFECLDRCCSCEERFCSACLEASAHSGEPCCGNCLSACARCGAKVVDCELDEDSLCTKCQAASEANPSPPPLNPDSPAPATAWWTAPLAAQGSS